MKINGKKAYITSVLIGVLGTVLIVLGISVIKPYGVITGLFFITHGLSLIAFALNLASQRHSNAKIEKLLKILINDRMVGKQDNANKYSIKK